MVESLNSNHDVNNEESKHTIFLTRDLPLTNLNIKSKGLDTSMSFAKKIKRTHWG